MAAPTVTDRPGTLAKVRYVRMSASKARVVLNLIRGKRVSEAMEILEFTERLAAEPIAKCLASAVANAEHNEDLQVEDLFISACFADEGPTLKRFRPRARGRAGRIHKQTCHITIVVSRLTDDELDELRQREELKSESRAKRSSSRRSGGGADRARRVAKSRAAEAGDTGEPEDQDADADDQTTDDQVEDAEATDETEAAAEEVADEATEETDTTDDVVDEATEPEAADETDSDADPANEEATDEVVTDDEPDDDAGAKE